MAEHKTLTRRSPFAAFTSLEREIRSIADRMGVSGVFEDFDWKPATDVFTHEGKLLIKAEVPGISIDDIDVEVVDDVLHISGEKSVERDMEDEDTFVRERTDGSFRRQVVLPAGVDVDSIDASYEDGVLSVVVDLPEVELEEAPLPIRIPVTG